MSSLILTVKYGIVSSQQCPMKGITFECCHISLKITYTFRPVLIPHCTPDVAVTLSIIYIYRIQKSINKVFNTKLIWVLILHAGPIICLLLCLFLFRFSCIHFMFGCECICKIVYLWFYGTDFYDHEHDRRSLRAFYQIQYMQDAPMQVSNSYQTEFWYHEYLNKWCW